MATETTDAKEVLYNELKSKSEYDPEFHAPSLRSMARRLIAAKVRQEEIIADRQRWIETSLERVTEGLTRDAHLSGNGELQRTAQEFDQAIVARAILVEQIQTALWMVLESEKEGN